MRQQLIPLTAALILATLPAAAGERSLDDTKALEGIWRVIELEANGERKPADEIQGTQLVIKDNELWAVKPTGPEPKLKFTLDVQQIPKAIDLTVQEGNDKGKVVLGVYSLQDGQLRLCINLFGEASHRPTQFKTQEGDGVAFATLEREKSN